MLDDGTKKRINSLRQILVGKLPDPKAQVEQITNGLIYKFMNDMDEQSLSMGGKSTYFSGKFQKYSWKNLLDTKTSGVEKIKLYSEAIEQMYTNENLPELFREIFKNSFLPFKDPSTLNMFLKEINEFHYSNSEKLGDAFEYLLSFMGSQGDAGQFRTPRHIIDFITEIVNPQKNETVLDPACGTAGFLISTYKHIIKQNTKKNLGDGLNASDRKKIGENLNGYDISPDMVKMSLVNMYLHKFTNPKINEYDTLSSEDRWNEYYDVILANPPFFSPKGGITPHNRFGVKSTKAEVLFIDYINEHLKPNGRAGIIVPEGVIFQSGTAYKQLRKKLIETSLIGVFSLPAGVFNPYSGVKTSVLILDKNLNKKIKDIFFIEIKNDGFSLNTNRNKIEGSEIGKKIKLIQDFYNNKKSPDSQYINKKDILDTDDVIFNFNKFIKKNTNETKHLVKLDDLVDVSNGFAFESKNYSNSGYRILRITNVQKGQIVDSNPKFHLKLEKDSEHKKFNVEENEILVSLTGNVGRVGKVDKNLLPAYLNQRVAKIKQKSDNKDNIKFLFHILNSEYFEKEAIINSFGVAQKNLSTKWISNFQIPLPSIEKQNQIVEELDGYQKIIDGCKQIIENYKPSIDIDPSWEMIELKNMCEKITDGSHNPPKVKLGGGHYMLSSKNIFNNELNFKNPREISFDDFNSENKRTDVKEGDILLTIVGTIGRSLVVEKNNNFTLQRSVAVFKVKKDIVDPYFINFVLQTNRYKKILNDGAHGVAQKGIYLKSLGFIKFPLPSLKIQNSITQKIKNEIELVEKNKLILKIFEEKINQKIASIWSN